MKRVLSMILCIGMLMSLFVCTAIAGDPNPFADVKESDYFYEPVLWAVANGITTGTSKDKFSPENPCTRGQVVTFLWRAAGKPEPTQTENPFTDVPTTQYYYKAVLWAVEEGITNGLTKDTFGPDKSCTRAQVVTFLWRAAGKTAPEKTDNPFSDVAQGTYYYEAVLWAVEKGITTGTSKTAFSPDKTCTRGQIVTFIYRYMTSSDPLEIVFQPEDYQMGSSQENAEFSATIKGGSAPYTYRWVVLYDNEEVRPDPVTTTGKIHVFTYNFSDYDFEENRGIGVYCIITDSKGATVETDFAEVLQYVYKPMTITSQPADYQMEGSQEDAEFTVCVEGGRAPYVYHWFVAYDNEEIIVDPVESDETSNTLLWNVSDYDFDEYNGIGVYCKIVDARGNSIESEFAVIEQYVYKPLSIKTQPADYQMTGSQEDATFTIELEGGRGPYTYRWFVMYGDNAPVWTDTVESNERSNTFTWNFSDYDFDDYSVIKVGCIVGDAKGDGLQSDFAIVNPK